MNNKVDSQNWAKDARNFFKRAQICFNILDWHGTVQNAQLCIEHSAKAIIAYFAEPEWTHNPAEQLLKIVSENLEELKKKGADILSLKKLAQYVKDVAPWHGLASYGEETDEGHVPASELCTEKIARELFLKAEESLQILENFLILIK